MSVPVDNDHISDTQKDNNLWTSFVAWYDFLNFIYFLFWSVLKEKVNLTFNVKMPDHVITILWCVYLCTVCIYVYSL